MSLVETFQDEHQLYLVFGFVQGGELSRLLSKEKIFPNDVALFYMAEMILAL